MTQRTDDAAGELIISDRDLEAFEHYDEPANREPAPGPTQKRRERAITKHVPVRFPASTVDAVRELPDPCKLVHQSPSRCP